jgi:hypothetical protein
MNYAPSWILIDTETMVLVKPVFPADLAAQLMRGRERDGEPFCYLLSHGCEIPAEASRVNGYTREILDREPPFSLPRPALNCILRLRCKSKFQVLSAWNRCFLLLQYCQLDIAAMVMIWKHWIEPSKIQR